MNSQKQFRDTLEFCTERRSILIYLKSVLADEDIEKISQIYIVACGSAYHVGMVAQYVIEDLAKIPVRVELGIRVPLS